MKCRVAQAVLITVLAGMFSTGLAQKNYYVVVGAFSTEGNAKDFTTHLPSLNADTAYASSEDDNVVHLYVFRTPDEQVAIAKSQQLQNSLENPDNGLADRYESVTVANLPEGRKVTVKKTASPMEESSLSDASGSRTAAPSGGGMVAAPMKPKGKLFKFTITDPKGNTIPGKVHYVDFEQERDLASWSAFTYTDILTPGRDKEMALVCGVFGYKQVEKYMNYGDPSTIEGVYQDEAGAWVIPYKLERLEKGDVSVMYNVAFHKDASVMLPPSRTDLDELVKMMKENPNYEITIHGHCNNKNDRKIISSAPGHFFEMKGSKQFFGSAKELSTLRADKIREYLLRNGINEKRIRTYAWGGRYMLVDPKSSVSKLNDRIEIEIRKD